jgi:hypothetical protein
MKDRPSPGTPVGLPPVLPIDGRTYPGRMAINSG